MSDGLSVKESANSDLRKADDNSELRRALEKLPPEERNTLIGNVCTVSTFSGPIPHPDLLKGYEDIAKGSAGRIISMAEKQQEHRMMLERKLQQTESRDSLAGILCATIISIGCLVAGVAVALKSPGVSGKFLGGLFGLSGIGSVMVTMIRDTRTQAKEKQNSSDDSDD